MAEEQRVIDLFGTSVLIALRDVFSARRIERMLDARGVVSAPVKTLDDAWHEMQLWAFSYNALIIDCDSDPDASCMSPKDFVRMVREHGYRNVIILLSSYENVELPYGMPVENCVLLRKTGSDDALLSHLAQTVAVY